MQICWYRATTQLQLEGVIASAAHCDVTNKAEVDALVNWTVQTYGAIDLLIANAGIVKGADFLDMTETDFDDVVRVNLKGVFLVSLHCFFDLRAGMGLVSNFLSLLQLSTTVVPHYTAMTCAWPSQMLKLAHSLLPSSCMHESVI